MIARIANQVHKGVFDGFDNGSVEFCIRAVHLQLDLLPKGDRHVAHHARQLVPDHADGLHARLHHALLQLAGDQVQALRSGIESGIFPFGVELQDLVTGKHQFSYQVHQLVQQTYAHADIGVGRGRLEAALVGLRSFARFKATVHCLRLRQRNRRHVATARVFGAGRRLRRETQSFGNILKAVRALFPGGLDRGQDLAGGVDGLQDERYKRRREFPLTVA